jgi:sec-independent protein translocase protein TatC
MFFNSHGSGLHEMTDKEKKTDEKKERHEKVKVGEMSFLEHLEELRWHIIRSFLAIIVLAIVAFIFRDFIFQHIILKPKMPDFWTNRMFAKLADLFGSEHIKINQKELHLINIKMTGQFSMTMWTALVAGLIMAAPVIFYEFWKFIKPALYENEKKIATGAVVYTSFLFLIGVLFGYYLIVPLSTQFFNTFVISPEVENQININSYISMVVSIVLASGIVFLLPVFSYSLSKVGILSPEFLKTYRRHAYVLLLLLAAIITPPDVFSQILVAIPLVLLYEFSIFISWRVVKNQEKKEKSNI